MTTVHTRLRLDEETTRLLDEYALRFGRDLRRLHALLRQGVSLKEAKNQFVREGLTARQFNGIAAKLRGMKESRESSYQLEMKSKGRRAQAIEKKLTLDPSRGGYPPRVRHQKMRVLARLQDFLKNAPDRKPRLLFGGKKLWQAQHHLKEDGFATHEEWRNAWREARSGEFFLIGSKDESLGNQSCHVDLDQETLTVRLPDAQGGLRVIPGVRFPYGREVLEHALEKGIAISYRFVRKKKGWYVFASTRAVRGERRTHRARGVLGVDLGPGEMAVVETDRIGNPVARKTYPLAFYHKTSFQARARTQEVAVQIGDWAKRCGKPLALENLEFEEKKALLRERGKGYARMLSSFAYTTMARALHSRCAREGVEVIRLNPAHTSTLGVIKFAAMYGLSGDEAAALALARRAQDLQESLPAGTAPGRPEDRSGHVWKHWRRLGKALRHLGRHAFLAAKRRSGRRRGYPVFSARASPAEGQRHVRGQSLGSRVGFPAPIPGNTVRPGCIE
ncbi:MAG TPA: transposase [Planctomycetota bacterium]|nr:transposase [Planctomycetota bacterium]